MTTCLCLPHRAGYEILSGTLQIQYPYPAILLLLSRSVLAQERTGQGKDHSLGLGQCICHPSYSLLPVRCPLQYSNQPAGGRRQKTRSGESKLFPSIKYSHIHIHTKNSAGAPRILRPRILRPSYSPGLWTWFCKRLQEALNNIFYQRRLL
jgi:hypothetical protein